MQPAYSRRCLFCPGIVIVPFFPAAARCCAIKAIIIGKKLMAWQVIDFDLSPFTSLVANWLESHAFSTVHGEILCFLALDEVIIGYDTYLGARYQEVSLRRDTK